MNEQAIIEAAKRYIKACKAFDDHTMSDECTDDCLGADANCYNSHPCEAGRALMDERSEAFLQLTKAVTANDP